MDYLSNYSFGIPGPVIWTLHLLIAAFLIYIGYNILYHKTLNTNWGLLLLILGTLAGFYHAHLWYLNQSQRM